jgi:hypothetical protein
MPVLDQMRDPPRREHHRWPASHHGKSDAPRIGYPRKARDLSHHPTVAVRNVFGPVCRDENPFITAELPTAEGRDFKVVRSMNTAEYSQ